MLKVSLLALILSFGLLSEASPAQSVQWNVPDRHKREQCPKEGVFEYGYVTKEYKLIGGALMMYHGPSHLTKKVGTIPEGEEVKILCKYGSQMFLVEKSDKTRGWVSQSYIRSY
jgi:hypothetical protein